MVLEPAGRFELLQAVGERALELVRVLGVDSIEKKFGWRFGLNNNLSVGMRFRTLRKCSKNW